MAREFRCPICEEKYLGDNRQPCTECEQREDCAFCNGAGKREIRIGELKKVVDCHYCGGTGKYFGL